MSWFLEILFNSTLAWGTLYSNYRPFYSLGVEAKPEKFVSENRGELAENVFYYENLQFKSSLGLLPVAAADDEVDYQRICECLGHGFLIYAESEATSDILQMIWIEEKLTTIKAHDRQLRLLICR